jgi:predicted RNase H-like nuclease (RuvC/YqgF family)
MPGKKPPPAGEVIIEEMRSQNRATIEAVHGMRDELKRDIAELREDTTARFQTLESAVRHNSTDIQTLQRDVRNHSTDIQTLQRDVRNLADKVEHLEEKVDTLSSIETRVSALERQRG